LSARKTAKELELDYKTVQSRFMQFRKAIAEYCKKEAKIATFGSICYRICDFSC